MCTCSVYRQFIITLVCNTTLYACTVYVHCMYLLLLLTANEYGLFNPDEDPTKGRWLEQGRTLEYYHLKTGV